MKTNKDIGFIILLGFLIASTPAFSFNCPGCQKGPGGICIIKEQRDDNKQHKSFIDLLKSLKKKLVNQSKETQEEKS